MADEAGQKAMLFFIEILMNSTEPIAIKQLAGRFGSKSFTPEMRTAAGGNEEGLRNFLSKYPSLFLIEGNAVSINNHGAPIPSISEEDTTESASPPLSAVEIELNAVKFFQDKLLRKGGKLPLISIAGHLSQAPNEMRNIVGPQSDFKSFVLKHKDIFVLDEDGNVGLTEDIWQNAQVETSMVRSESDTSLEANTSTSAKSISRDSKSKPSPITMTASEYKTMKYLKGLVESNNGHISLASALEKIPCASDPIKNIIGDSEQKLTDFVLKFPNIFCLVDSEIALKKTKLNVIMAGSRPSGSESIPSPKQEISDSLNSSISSNASDANSKSQSVINSLTSSTNGSTYSRSSTAGCRTLNNHKGPVYHLAKLWGIVDLGKHEHVFFDRSILPDGYDDLSKKFQIGETLRFNAVRAARGSRARWRATHVWRDGEDIRSMYGSEATFSLTGYNTDSVDNEVKTLLTKMDNTLGPSGDFYVDAAQSSTGCIPVFPANTFSGAGDDKSMPTYNTDVKYPTKSVKGSRNTAPGSLLISSGDGKNISRKLKSSLNGDLPSTREVACQTLSTGDIMATQLYQDED